MGSFPGYLFRALHWKQHAMYKNKWEVGKQLWESEKEMKAEKKVPPRFVDETSGMPYVAQVTSKYDEPELDDAIGRQKKWRESG